ncbi:MAG: DUF1173 family protein, partial [Hyphomicrobiales bacterium]|nr:DUF1173 family protein [Hyphomicrobiales bacterium]
FKAEFAACGANSRIHLIACCLVDFNKAGYPSLAEIGFLTVSPEWLPFSSEAEAMLIQSLIEGGRSFTKTLRYDLPDEATIAAAILKDVGAEGIALFLDDGSRADALRQALEDCPMPTWVWNILEPMPPFAESASAGESAGAPALANQPASARLATIITGFIRLAPLSASLPAPFSRGPDSSSGRIE